MLATCSRESVRSVRGVDGVIRLPTVEVHLSKHGKKPQDSRHKGVFRALTSRGSRRVIRGLGALSYTLALHALAGILATHAEGNCNV